MTARFLGAPTAPGKLAPSYIECDCLGELLQIWADGDFVDLRLFGEKSYSVVCVPRGTLCKALSQPLQEGIAYLVTCLNHPRLAIAVSVIDGGWTIGLYRKGFFRYRCLWEVVSNQRNLLKLQELIRPISEGVDPFEEFSK